MQREFERARGHTPRQLFQRLLARAPAPAEREQKLQICGAGVSRALSFSTDQMIWLGRAPACQVVLPSEDVSRLHASLFVRDGVLFVRDHSSYGTRVNGQPLQHAVRSASTPARIGIGTYELQVVLDAQLSARFRAWSAYALEVVGLR